MNDRYESVMVQVVTRVMVPFMQLFGLYVLFHGHYSPGGGFQAGAILAASILLTRVTLGRSESHRLFPEKVGYLFGAIGVTLYFLTGFIPLLLGGSFLDYGHLPIPGLTAAELRYEGILIIEIGVAFAVSGVLVSIFDSLAREE